MADWAQVSTAATDRAVTLMPQSVSWRVSCRCRPVPRGTDFALGILGGAPHQSLDQRGMACNYSPRSGLRNPRGLGSDWPLQTTDRSRPSFWKRLDEGR